MLCASVSISLTSLRTFPGLSEPLLVAYAISKPIKAHMHLLSYLTPAKLRTFQTGTGYLIFPNMVFFNSLRAVFFFACVLCRFSVFLRFLLIMLPGMLSGFQAV